MKYKVTYLREVVSFISKGIAPKYVEKDSIDSVRVVNQRCNRNNRISLQNSRLNNLKMRNVPKIKYLHKGDILINSTGVGTAGRVAQIKENFDKPVTFDGHMILIRGNSQIDSLFLGYYLEKNQRVIEQFAEGSTGQTEINRERLLDELVIKFPTSVDEQRRLAEKFRLLDRKIDLNNQINDNLFELNKIIFNKVFASSKNYVPASDIAEIKIGKTPPRKEKQWFSVDKGINWLSIKDMKSEGIFSMQSKEKLLSSAINKFNIQTVNEDTVLLSFKLTIGRVKLAAQEMVTNEAIAQFKNSKLPYQYLYTYLKLFHFETLGSTSSIAKAINSKILKSMPILKPSTDDLNKYMNTAKPIFEKVKINQLENINLLNIKKYLLNKLK